MNTFSTTEVRRMLGESVQSLAWHIRTGTLPTPQKDSSGNFRWTEEEVDNAREILEALSRTGRRRMRPVTEPV